jgi:hypothetical protein
MTPTIGQIEEEYGQVAGELLSDFYRATDEAAMAIENIEVPRGVQLTGQQRQQAAQEAKAQRVAAVAEANKQAYIEATQERNEAIRARKDSVSKKLFGNIEDTDALSRALTTSDDGLRAMLEGAKLSGNQALARAAFLAAHQRQLPEVISGYLEMDPEAAELYEELQSAPSDAALDNKVHDADKMFTPPPAHSFIGAR